MPRRLRRRSFTKAEVHVYPNLAATEEEALPQDVWFLQEVIRSILARTAKDSPDEAAMMQNVLRVVAMAERQLITVAWPPDERKRHVENLRSKIYPEALKGLRFGVPHTTNCNPHILRLHRDLLAHYLAEYPFPVGITGKRIPWVEENWEQITRLLTGMPCCCRYTIEIDDKLKDAALTCSTENGIVLCLLAHIHNSTPRNIKRLIELT